MAVADNAGNSSAQARNIGSLGIAIREYNDWVGLEDPYDFYAFTLPVTSVVTLREGGVASQTGLTLYDSADTTLAWAFAQPGGDATLSQQLAPGRYVVKVNNPAPAGTNHRFSASAAPVGLASGSLAGGPGVDTVPVAAVRRQAGVTIAGGDGTVTSPGRVDALTSVEAIRFIDGTMAYDAATPEAQVARLYQAAFGRTADPAGLGGWASLVRAGVPLVDVAGAFIASPEFAQRYGNPDAAGFVTIAHQNALGLTPDAATVSAWGWAVASGALTRAQVLAGFSEHPTSQARTAALVGAGIWAPDPQAASVARLYYTALGRAPDAAGLGAMTAQVAAGARLQDAAAAMVGGPEFFARYGALDNAGFVDRLYRNALGRAPDPAGFSGWTGALATGTSRADVAVLIGESAEARARLFPAIEQAGVAVV